MESSLHLLLPLLLLCSNLLLHHTSATFPLQSNSQLESRDENNLLLRRPHSRIFHPSTGLCVMRRLITDPLKLGPCSKSDSWRYTPQQFLVVSGTYFCLQAVELGKPVKLGIICEPPESQWMFVSNSEKTHLATKLADGTEVCLDVDSDGVLVSNSCSGFHREDTKYLDMDSQWFKLVTGYNKVKLQSS